MKFMLQGFSPKDSWKLWKLQVLTFRPKFWSAVLFAVLWADVRLGRIRKRLAERKCGNA